MVMQNLYVQMDINQVHAVMDITLTQQRPSIVIKNHLLQMERAIFAKQCTYSCPSGYSTSVSCSAGYETRSAYKVNDQNESTCPSSYTLCYKCVEVSVDYYTTVVPSGKGNALKLVIKASGTVGKDYTVEYDGTATVSGGHTDGTEGTCDSMMRLISSCKLSSGSSETSCVMYEAACENISWSGSLTLP